MDLREYQQRALQTDQVTGDTERAIIIPLLGLAGEAGTLLSEYKKHLRDGEAHRLHKERVGEELGDLLWYLSNVASKYGLDLDAVAEANLAKAHGRWTLRGRAGADLGPPRIYDAGFPEHERFPRQFDVELSEIREGDAVKVRTVIGGKQVGDPLTDNAYRDDGYRFHDVFHLAHAAVLGWSPVSRWLLKRKRKSDPVVDEVEDGGRARVIEEGLAAIVFAYAQNHAFLEGVTTIDEALLRVIKNVTSPLEVAQCSAGEWESAILQGYDAWRQVVAQGGGRLLIDLDARSISFSPQ